MQATVIEAKQLGKTYQNAPQPSLIDVNLNIYRGEKFGVFGPNGAGKTTLISILCGLLKSTTGEVKYFFENGEATVKQIISRIGYVPQEFAFYSQLSPIQNLQFFGKMHGIPQDTLQERMLATATSLGLENVLHKKINTFSGGMKRRVNLAIGLINKPDILFLDEPTAGIDIQSKMMVTALLNEINKDGTTIIYTSHHLKEAEDFCDRVAIINHGEIIALGSLEQLMQSNEVLNLESLLIKLTNIELH